jgi:hypothetical protein
MLVNKTIPNNEDVSTMSHTSGHTWSPGSNVASSSPREQEWELIHQASAADDVLSAPGRMNQTDEIGLDGLDSHEYPAFVSAVPVDTNEQDGDGFPVAASIEVDAENRTIRVEMEQDAGETPSDYNSKGASINSPMSKLTRYQTCWLIVFVRKCARKTGAYSRAAARKYSPKAKRVAGWSATAIKDASARFNENHQVGDKTRTSIKVVGRHVKKATKATVKGVKQASVATTKGIKGLDEKHHIVRKSKNSLKKGGRFIRNAWNGKPLNTRGPSPAADSSSSHAVEGSHTFPTAGQEESSPKTPQPSSE